MLGACQGTVSAAVGCGLVSGETGYSQPLADSGRFIGLGQNPGSTPIGQ